MADKGIYIAARWIFVMGAGRGYMLEDFNKSICVSELIPVI